ncbi:MAG: phosphate transport system regulatory protein PhoU [Lentisphaerae bacterium RIFOXYA12_FULL_48_11]|nr:MAG: phosphate transport system regulatory protein PhoU [Lentisphaerae bacterium RIFOXYA12_FULL_48_11]
MSKQFDQDLNSLKEKLLTMAATAEKMIHDTLQTLVKRDLNLFDPVKEAEDKMDILQREIDEETVRMISIYTPVASDLRLLLMTTKISAELERIGDKAMDIGFYTKNMLKEPPLKPLVDLPRMAEESIGMLKKAMDAYTDASTAGAIEVIRMDDEVDNLHDQLFRELMTYVLSDPKTINRVLELILISRAFERIADHSVNISEDVFYMVKGQDIRHIKNIGEIIPG